MEGIHSYERRSVSSDAERELDLRRSRVIIVDRHQPNVSFTPNQYNYGTFAHWLCSFVRSRRASWCSSSCGGSFSDNKANTKPNSSSSSISSSSGGAKVLASTALPALTYTPSLASVSNSKSQTNSAEAKFDCGPFATNEWRTSKYTFLNFLPKNLFEQFRRFANFYFLITSILQIVIPFSPVGPLTSLLPLVFVVSATSIKQAYEDYLRHKLDREVNNRWCHILQNKKLIRIRSKDIRVGDFVYVKNNEEIPCDMLLLAVGGQADRCYVTTANLDGETNLKSRSCFDIKDQLGSIEKIDDSLLVIECEKPNATLYEFNGYMRAPKSKKSYSLLMSSYFKETPSVSTSQAGAGAGATNRTVHYNARSIMVTILKRIRLSKSNLSLKSKAKKVIAPASTAVEKEVTVNSSASQIQEQRQHASKSDLPITTGGAPLSISLEPPGFYEIPLDINNLLLRASRLRNTSYIYGLAIYTGKDTKLAHNSQVKPNKFSSIERKVNIFLFIAFLMLSFLSLAGALMYRAPNFWFFQGLEKSDSFGQILVAHFLIYNYLVPISLYVTLEFVKFFGTFAVLEDKRMKVTVWRTITQESSSDSTGKQHRRRQPSLLCQSSDFVDEAMKSAQIVAPEQPGKPTGTRLAKEGLEGNFVSTMSSAKRIQVVEGAKCNSSDLNEELGQVEVLFSDKTGTLTENKMRFMACSVYTQMYRSIGGSLYLEPASLYRASIPKLVDRLARVSTNRHMLLVPAGHRHHRNESIMSPPAHKATLVASSNCNQQQNTSQRKAANQTKSTPASDKKPFDHRSIPALSSLRRVDNMDRQETLVEFFICLCLCSTITLNERLPLAECLPDRTMNEYDFQSASPDEESLISAAHLYGVTMCKSNDRECFIVIKSKTTKENQPEAATTQTNNSQAQPAAGGSGNFKALLRTKNSTDKYIVRHFERLLVFEFNSIRKRMSVIYRDCDNDCILMATKGSEEMLDCIQLNNLDQEGSKCVDVTLAHFEAFAKSGLRTLLVGRRVLSREEFESISNEMHETRLSIQNRDQLLNALYKRAESSLKLIGTTAVEDTLQENVPETIANLKEAGIKVWLLTGDKVETAISVAYLCKLLDREMILCHLVRQQDAKACRKLLTSFCQKVKSMNQACDPSTMQAGNDNAGGIGNGANANHQTTATKSRLSSDSSKLEKEHKFALIADGRSLYYAMKYVKDELAELCEQCTCVLGCRLSPLQKAEVVDMIKKGKNEPITAAIGDGANDVSMIQEAHVGIGVSGKEGRQAVNCSDFSINRFYMLNRLLFVHGHLFYHRTANTIHYFFYKNLLFILPQFLYSFYNFSSAKSLYHPILLIGYNLFFTSLPILLYGLFEIHIPENILENYPRLYRINRRNSQLSLTIFFTWLLIGAIQAIIGFYFLYYNWGSHTAFLESGKMAGINGFSVILYFVTVITATFKLFFLSKSHTLSLISSAFFSFAMLPLILYIYSVIDWGVLLSDNSLCGHFEIYLRSPMFWTAIGVTSAATLLPNIIYFLNDRTIYFSKLSEVIEHAHNRQND